MDNFLADLYGTNEPEAEDFEKVAHLDFLEKVAEDEGIDLDELSDEDLEDLADLAAEALDEEDGGEYYDDDGEELEKEAEAKVEEADFLGRVMAHSFNQEIDNIDKEAGARIDATKAAIGKGYRGAKSVAREGYGRGGRAAGQTGRFLKKSPLGRLTESSTVRGRMKSRLRSAGSSIDKGVRGLGRRLGAETTGAGAARGAKSGGRAGASSGWNAPRKGGKARRALDWATSGRKRRMAYRGAKGSASGARAGAREAMKSQRRRGYGAIGGAAALGAGAAGGAAYYNREKKSADEQWEEAVQARAWEHLMAAGLADESGNFIPAEDFGKTASDEDVEYQLDADALEILEAEGYPVEWY